jgi:outer membrane autotransporter protein
MTCIHISRQATRTEDATRGLRAGSFARRSFIWKSFAGALGATALLLPGVASAQSFGSSLSPLTTVTTGGCTVQVPTAVSNTSPLASGAPSGAAALQAAAAIACSATGMVSAAQGVSRVTAGVVMDHVAESRSQMQSRLPIFSQITSFAGAPENAAFTQLVSKGAPAVSMARPAPVTRNVSGAIWIRPFGDYDRRDFGLTSVRQSQAGFLAGVDATIENVTSPNDGLLIGAFGGFVSTRTQTRGVFGDADLTGGIVGVLGSYFNGGFFIDAQLKGEFLELDEAATPFIPGANPAFFTGRSVDVRNFNVSGAVGYKFELGNGYYIEPSVAVDHVTTSFDGNSGGLGLVVTLPDADATRGRIGARFGTVFTSGNVRVEPSITANVWHVFDASNPGFLVNNLAGTVLTGSEEITYGEIGLGANFLTTGGLSGFARAEVRFGEDVFGVGGRLGLRYRF